MQLALAYSTVYQLGLQPAGIRQAVDRSRNNSRLGMVNIEAFITAVLDTVGR